MSELSLSVQGVTLQSQELVKLLGVIIDKGERINENVSYICKKAAQQLNSLSRLSSVSPVDSMYCIYDDAGKKSFDAVLKHPIGHLTH